MDVDKVQRVSITDQIYDAILAKIASGEWKSGEKIPSEIELAEQMGVSRVSLKMALQKMNALGILETRVGEGTFVLEFSFSSFFKEIFDSNIVEIDCKQLVEFRYYLEANVLNIVINNPTDKIMLNKLENELRKMEQAFQNKDLDEFSKSHFSFHHRICKMSKNQLFILMYDSTSKYLYEIYKRNMSNNWNEEANHFHRRIFEAIKNKDKKLAEQAMQEEYFRIPEQISYCLK